jgi:hypothetical protein
VALDEHAPAVVQVVPAGLQEPAPEPMVGHVDQERAQQHGVEAPAQPEVLDPGPDGLGAVDAGQHLGRLVHRHHRMPEGDQRMGHPPGPGPQLQDRGPGRDRGMHDPGFAHGRQQLVEVDCAAVRRDGPGPGPRLGVHAGPIKGPGGRPTGGRRHRCGR